MIDLHGDTAMVRANLIATFAAATTAVAHPLSPEASDRNVAAGGADNREFRMEEIPAVATNIHSAVSTPMRGNMRRGGMAG
ncbi:hypothetical protein ACW2Q0_24480, partial [Nocardia sp. R16R-3T]